MGFKDDVISGFGQGLAGAVFGGISAKRADKYATKQAQQNFELQKKENEQVFQQNKELAAYQNSLNLAQWNRENEYNTPAAQMARYAAAGLNPDLIYGQQNNAAASPQLIGGTSKQPANSAEARNAATQSMASLQNVFAQNALLHAQAENVKADTDNKKADTKSKEIENQFNLETFSKRILGIDLSNQTSSQVVENLIKEGKLLDTNRDKTVQEIENLKKAYEQLEVNIDEGRARIQNLNEDTKNKILEGAKLMKEIDKVAAEIYNINQQAEYYRQKGITEADVRVQLRAMAKYYLTNADLNEQQFAQNKILFPLQEKQAQKQLVNTDASTAKLKSEKAYVDKQTEMYKENSRWNNINNSVNAAANVTNAVGNFLGGIGEIIPF